METTILLGIISMISFGIADVLIAGPSRRLSTFKILYIESAFSFILYISLSLFIHLPANNLNFATILLIIFAGVSGIIAGISFYNSFIKGKIGIVVPIANSYSIVVVFIGIFLFSEVLTLPQIFGILCVIGGIFTLSAKANDFKNFFNSIKNSGINFALIAMIGWGILVVLMDILSSEIGWFQTILFINVTTLILMTPLLIIKKEFNFKGVAKSDYGILAIISILFTLAFITLSYGLQIGSMIIIAPIAGAAPLVSAIISHFFTNDKLNYKQFIIVTIIILGVVLLNF